MINVCIFSRCSTQVQDHQHQITHLQELSKKNNWNVVKVFIETASGAKNNSERPVLLEMLEYIKENKIDKVLCFELSRIGRRVVEVLQTLELIEKAGASCYIDQFTIETRDSQGNPNPLSGLLTCVMASVSNLERSQIRSRMESGYKNFRLNGGVVGRKNGYRKVDEVYLKEYPEVIKLLNSKKKYSLRKIAKLADVSVGTVQKIKGIIGEAAIS